jgi:hypothetical protein
MCNQIDTIKMIKSVEMNLVEFEKRQSKKKNLIQLSKSMYNE